MNLLGSILRLIGGALMMIVFVFIIFLCVFVIQGRAQAPDIFILRESINATDQEAQEGYFSLGSTVMIVTKPGTDMHRWFQARVNQKYSISFRPDTE